MLYNISKHRTASEQFKMWVLAWVGIADEAVTVVSLGFWSVDWRARVLFSAWMDREGIL